jgi:CubicO group peptidase (beta-lactamase class C family)
VGSIRTIGERVQQVLAHRADELLAGGAVVAVDVGGERVAFAHGRANLNTGEPFTADTGFLIGSITKLQTTTMVLRLAERGEVDLDAPATRYVPEFTLRNRDATEQITVRMLLNHTNGIDACWLSPDGVRGRDANRSYVECLAVRDVLFEPGTYIHYSNPGLVLAARVVEERTGLPFERAIAQELYEPCGMPDSTAVQTQAFLRRTAVGSFVKQDGSVEAVKMFTLPESGAGCGNTPIGTAGDLLTFARMHLNDGVAPNGTRVLSGESVEAMQTVSFAVGSPEVPSPIGLGWWLTPLAGTTVLNHGGGSPGGASLLSVVPEHDAAIASFVSGGTGGPTGGGLNDLLHNAVLEELTGRQVTPTFDYEPTPPADDVTGVYAFYEARVTVERDGDRLLVSRQVIPDEDNGVHRHIVYGYTDGVILDPPPVPYVSVAPDRFAPEGLEYTSMGGIACDGIHIAFRRAGNGRGAGLHQGVAYFPKES